ncbi:MAG: sugar phosphate nucleotidyltransferase, partial [Anaerococcus sp.]|nr:sugar phosphate nucleotidyltransferase [Anaerococcus sp.]
TEVEEKPENPKSNLASMGIYVFNWKVLRKALIEDNENPESSNDFGKDIIPKMLNDNQPLYVYKFDGYWKDVGTVRSYWQANLDLINPDNELGIYDEDWKIYTTSLNLPPHRIGPKGTLNDALVNEACVIDGKVENSVLFSNVTVAEGAEVYNSVLLNGSKVNAGCKIYNCVVAEDIEITEERINSIYAMGKYFALMANDKTFEAKSVILATGIEYTRPIKGEEEYLGKGVGYCATCDAPLYKGKVVTIIGHNKEAEEEANYVSELAGEVYYVPMYKGNYNLRNNIKVVEDKPQEIVGELKVNKLILKNTEIETDAVFLLKDSISPGQLVPGLKIEENHIFVDRLMKTNIPGCFAAGDCVGKPYQYIKSAGEGNIAALSAVQYLDKI